MSDRATAETVLIELIDATLRRRDAAPGRRDFWDLDDEVGRLLAELIAVHDADQVPARLRASGDPVGGDGVGPRGVSAASEDEVRAAVERLRADLAVRTEAHDRTVSGAAPVTPMVLDERPATR